MKKPLVSVVIVGFNAKHFLSKCLGSLMRGSYTHFEVLYIDNGSSDGTSEYIRKHYPKIKIIRYAKNLGFSPAHEGLLEKIKGDCVLLLNTDTILNKNLLSSLIATLYEKKDIGAVQPKILMYPKTNKIDSIGSFLLWNGFLYHVGYDKNQGNPKYNKSTEIFSTKGAVMLIKRSVLIKISFPSSRGHKANIFDKDYFIAFEDTDLCHRIWLSGYRILYVPSAKVYHLGGGTVKKLNLTMMIFNSEKNRIMTYVKNLSFPFMLRVLPQLFVMLQVEFLMYLIIRRNISVSFSIQRAIFWNVLHLNETLKKRAYVQGKIRKVSDYVFLPNLVRPVRLSYYYYLMKGLGGYKD